MPGSTGTKVQDAAAQGTQQVVQQAQQVAQGTQQQAGQAANIARQQIKSQLSSQKDRATGQLGTVSQALRQTGQQLQDQGQGTVGQYATKAADQIDNLSSYLQGRNIDQLVGEVESFARSRPTLFLGGAFMLGVIGARFLKSSSEQAGAQGTSYADGQSGYSTPPYATGYEAV